MDEHERVLPDISEEGRPFWEACRRHEFRIQQCSDCHQYQFPPRTMCSNCMSTNLELAKASGKGTVYSCSTLFRPPVKEFAKDVPYVVALIDLAEGPRMISNVVGCKPEEVKIGMQVEVVFEDLTSEVSLPKFRPLA